MTAVGLVLVGGGVFFMLTGAIGLIRFPDFYTRMHAAGKCDTLGSLLVLTGLAWYGGFVLASVKLLIVALFIFVTSRGESMIWQLDIVLLGLAIICAVAAVGVRDLLASVVLLGAFSLFMCLLWIEMGAVDVAFTEAAVGAGITTVFFVITVYKTERVSKD